MNLRLQSTCRLIPVLNESEETSEPLCREFTETRTRGGVRTRFSWDDGSDEGRLKYCDVCRPQTRVARHSVPPQFWQTAAFAAALRTPWTMIATADGDCRTTRGTSGNVARLEGRAGAAGIAPGRGYQLGVRHCVRWRKDRKDAFINRRLPSTWRTMISWGDGRETQRYGFAEGLSRRGRQTVTNSMARCIVPARPRKRDGRPLAEHVVNHRPGSTEHEDGNSRTSRVVLDLGHREVPAEYSRGRSKNVWPFGTLMGARVACCWRPGVHAHLPRLECHGPFCCWAS